MPYLRIHLSNVLTNQVELNKDQLTIGRSADSDIVLDNAGVSSRHAMIQKEGSGYVIADNGSSNGVFVNGKKIDRHTLEYRDEIQIYNYVLKYMASRGLQGIADPDPRGRGVPRGRRVAGRPPPGGVTARSEGGDPRSGRLRRRGSPPLAHRANRPRLAAPAPRAADGRAPFPGQRLMRSTDPKETGLKSSSIWARVPT